MHPFVTKIEKTIRSGSLLAAEERCVVAVSGGPDSMALLHVLAQLAPALDLYLVVAHVDHGLRPEEAEREAALVREAARTLGLVCECGRVAVRACAREHGFSLEHAARNLRYGFLEEVATRHRATKIAVAHTADDQAEEILLRLIRGTGRAGLAGMAGLRDGLVVRPFLETPKAEILRYLATENIPCCQDSSNLRREYLRNRIRLDLLPYLREHFNPNIDNTLRETGAILAGEEELLAGMAARAYGKVVEEQDGLAELAIRLADFLPHPLAMQRRILETACWRMGSPPTFRQIAQLLFLAETGRQGAELHLAQGLRVVKAEGRMVFRYPRGRLPVRGTLPEAGTGENGCVMVLSGPGEYLFETMGTVVSLCLLDALPDGWKSEAPATLYFDADRLCFPLTIRAFRAGDRFHPQGAPGSKKVGDFFTDQKVPAAQRKRLPLLADAQGIIAILGLRPDRRAAIGPGTKRTLAVSVRPASPGENGFTEKANHGK